MMSTEASLDGFLGDSNVLRSFLSPFCPSHYEVKRFIQVRPIVFLYLPKSEWPPPGEDAIHVILQDRLNLEKRSATKKVSNSHFMWCKYYPFS